MGIFLVIELEHRDKYYLKYLFYTPEAQQIYLNQTQFLAKMMTGIDPNTKTSAAKTMQLKPCSYFLDLRVNMSDFAFYIFLTFKGLSILPCLA